MVFRQGNGLVKHTHVCVFFQASGESLKKGFSTGKKKLKKKNKKSKEGKDIWSAARGSLLVLT